MRGSYICDFPVGYNDVSTIRAIKFACFDEEVQDIVSHIQLDDEEFVK